MQVLEHKKIYIPDEEVFSFQDTLLENISLKIFVVCSKEKYLQYQKDIFEEFVADFSNLIKVSEELDYEDIREIFGQHLQLLNTKLKSFAEKVRDVEHFQLKGIIQLILDDKLMSSMIGDVRMMIVRDQKTIYSVQNNIDTRLKIDICSDFIEGNLERDDQILYVGLRFSDVIDSHDLREMDNLLAQEESADGILSFIEELLLTRVEKSTIGFIISYFIQGPSIKISKTPRKGGLKLKGVKGKSQQYMNNIGDKITNSEFIQGLKKKLLENKVYFIGLILVVLIFVFVYALISQILNNSRNNNKFQTGSGYVEINLEDIQRDITEFKSLEPSSSLKTTKYNEIASQLEFLKSQGKWLEDVEDLQTQLKDNYYKGFNIYQIQSESDLDNIAGRNTKILTFNSSDLDRMGNIHSISVPRNMMIAGDKGAMIDASSDTNRGHFQSYNLTKPLEDCISALNANGLYCYNGSGEIYMISKTGIVPVQTEEGDFRQIGGLGTFSSKNLYVFNSNVSKLGNMLLTRYQTSDGTYANFKGGTSYSVNASGVDFGTFSSFAIDGNFYGRADGKMYQFWRDDLAGSTLNYREIAIDGGNPLINSHYSDDIKIITSSSTRYIFIYDKKQQILTVYNSEKIKTNENNKLSFRMVYLFSIKFEIEGLTVYDVDIPSSTGDRPEAYILTSGGVNKIALYEYIETHNNN